MSQTTTEATMPVAAADDPTTTLDALSLACRAAASVRGDRGGEWPESTRRLDVEWYLLEPGQMKVYAVFTDVYGWYGERCGTGGA